MEVQSVILSSLPYVNRPAVVILSMSCSISSVAADVVLVSEQCGGGQHTMAWCANALISLMARGALFLKETPCSCYRTTLSATQLPIQST